MAHHFLLLAIASILVTLLLLTPPTVANSPVLDVEGNPLEAGSPYYVLTAGWGAPGRGGLTHVTMPPPDHRCLRYVAQHSLWIANGAPVFFYPSDSSQKHITIGDDVMITFGLDAWCRASFDWKVTLDNETNIPYIATYGGFDTFKIETTSMGFSYKIVFCSEQETGNIVGTTRNCKQLDATEKGPLDLSYLSLVPLDQGLPFFGFVFRKLDSSATTAASY